MLKGVLTLSIANLLAQAIGFGSAIFVARLFGPLAIGAYYSVFALSAVLVAFLTIQTHLLISNAESDEEASDVYRAAQAVATLFFLLVLLIAALGFVAAWHWSDHLAKAALMSYLQVLVQCKQLLHLRTQNGSIKCARLVFFRAVILSAFQIAGGVFVAPEEWVLTTAAILADLLSAILIGNPNNGRGGVIRTHLVSARGLPAYVRRSISLTIAQAFSMSANYAPVMVLNKAGLVSELGNLSMAQRLIGTPVYAFANALRPVLWKYVNERKVSPANLGLKALTLGIVGAAVLYIFFSQVPLAIWLLGDKWLQASVYIPYVCLWILPSASAVVISELSRTFGNPNNVLIHEALGAMPKIAVGWMFWSNPNGEEFIIFFLLACCVVSLAGSIWQLTRLYSRAPRAKT